MTELKDPKTVRRLAKRVEDAIDHADWDKIDADSLRAARQVVHRGIDEFAAFDAPATAEAAARHNAQATALAGLRALGWSEERIRAALDQKPG